jgi:hypothetical protein
LVFKLIKLLVGLVGLGVFVWWGLTVPLGDRTLFGHLSAIGQTKESQDLVRGTRQKVGDLKKRIGGGAASPADKPAPAPASEPADPQERLTNADHKEIRHLLDRARTKVTKGTN